MTSGMSMQSSEHVDCEAHLVAAAAQAMGPSVKAIGMNSIQQYPSIQSPKIFRAFKDLQIPASCLMQFL